MRDVAERSAVHERGAALEGLEEVRLDGIGQQSGHGPGHPKVVGGHGRSVGAHGEDHPAQSGTQVVDVTRQRQHRHHFRGDRDLPLRLARDAVLPPAEADDRAPDRPIADVDDARPDDRVRVDPEPVLMVKAVVEECGGEVVGRADGVVVAGQMEVEVVHRQDLAVAAAGCPTLDPKHRSERRLTNAHRGLPSDPVEALGQTDGRR